MKGWRETSSLPLFHTKCVYVCVCVCVYVCMTCVCLEDGGRGRKGKEEEEGLSFRIQSKLFIKMSKRATASLACFIITDAFNNIYSAFNIQLLPPVMKLVKILIEGENRYIQNTVS